MRFARYAIFVPEAAQSRLGRMQGHAPEDAGQLDDALILGRQRLPVILEDQITGENGLVPFPVRIPTGDFRHESDVSQDGNALHLATYCAIRAPCL